MPKTCVPISLNIFWSAMVLLLQGLLLTCLTSYHVQDKTLIHAISLQQQFGDPSDEFETRKTIEVMWICCCIRHLAPADHWGSRKQGLCHLPQLCSAPDSPPKVEASCSRNQKTISKIWKKKGVGELEAYFLFDKCRLFHRGACDLSPLLGWIALVTKTVKKNEKEAVRWI